MATSTASTPVPDDNIFVDLDRDHKLPESDDSDEQDDEESDESDHAPVETLVAGRERRDRAGNRYAQLLQLEQQKAAEAQEDDDLALLFEENEEDVEFADPDAVEGASDEDEDTSSDDEDRAPVAGEEELEGEKQLEKEERAYRRASKRKAEKAIIRPTARRKRIRVDDNAQDASSSPGEAADEASAARPRKRSERMSWLPTDADAPVRSSSRMLSVQNKQKTLESMKVSDAKRARQIAVMEAANRRRVQKKAPMTQEERLAEATQVERLNSKSLNKWEETEKDRLEKQRLRLEALQNRKMKGPVIRWYSGRAEWVGDKLESVGKRVPVEELEDETVTNGIRLSVDVAEKKTTVNQIQPPLIVVEAAEDVSLEHNQSLAAAPDQLTHPESTQHSKPNTDGEPLPLAESQTQEAPNFMHGLEYYASLPANARMADEDHRAPVSAGLDLSKDLPTPPIRTCTESTATAVNDLGEVAALTAVPALDMPIPAAPSEPSKTALNESLPTILGEPQTNSSVNLPPPAASNPAPIPPKAAEPITHSTRSLITFLSFDTAAIANKDIQRRILFKWPAPPATSLTTSIGSSSTTSTGGYIRKALRETPSSYNPPRPVQPICVITGAAARYKDPLTGLPYRGLEEFKALRGLVSARAEGDSGGQPVGAVWSGLLGAWVGKGAARGVPARFLGAIEKESVKVEGSGGL